MCWKTHTYCYSGKLLFLFKLVVGFVLVLVVVLVVQKIVSLLNFYVIYTLPLLLLFRIVPTAMS